MCTNKRAKILQDSLTSLKSVDLQYAPGKTFKWDIGPLEFAKQTSTNSSIREPSLNRLCETVSGTKKLIQTIIEKVYGDFVAKFGDVYTHQLDSIIKLVTHLDLIISKACVCSKFNYCKPIIKPGTASYVQAKNLRHCLISNKFSKKNCM